MRAGAGARRHRDRKRTRVFARALDHLAAGSDWAVRLDHQHYVFGIELSDGCDVGMLECAQAREIVRHQRRIRDHQVVRVTGALIEVVLADPATCARLVHDHDRRGYELAFLNDPLYRARRPVVAAPCPGPDYEFHVLRRCPSALSPGGRERCRRKGTMNQGAFMNFLLSAPVGFHDRFHPPSRLTAQRLYGARSGIDRSAPPYSGD